MRKPLFLFQRSSPFNTWHITLVLFLSSVLVYLWGNSPSLVWKLYAHGLYPPLSSLLRLISGIFPFSIGDFLYAALALFLLFRLARILQKNRKGVAHVRPWYLRLLFFFLQTGFSLYLTFNLIWGLNYSRPPIHTQLGLQAEKYTVEDLLALTNWFIVKTNALQENHPLHFTRSVDELRKQSVLAFRDQSNSSPLFKYRFAAVKSVLNAEMISKLGIEGYYNPLSGEAHVNPMLPPWVLPYTTCHEIAHQLGIAKEDEANLIGYMVAIQSKNPSFRYSANYNMLRYLFYEVRLKAPNQYDDLVKMLSPRILKHFSEEQAFWSAYNGQMSAYMGMTFDRFLKMNDQPQGIESYQNIVIWLWNLHKNELIAKERTGDIPG